VIHKSVETIKGVGTRSRELLEQLGIETIDDLLFHIPVRYVDRTNILKVADVRPGIEGFFKGRLSGHISHIGRGRRKMRRAVFTDESGSIPCIWFGKYIGWQWREDEDVLLFGRVGKRANPVLMHPEIEPADDSTLPFVPVYRLTAGITQKRLRSWIATALDSLPTTVSGIIPEDIARRSGWSPLKDALVNVHRPTSIANAYKSADRLRIERIVPFQLSILKRRDALQRSSSFAMTNTSKSLIGYLRQLPFTLTRSQSAALEQIRVDMSRSFPMHRLLQGDVGSGKTAVATAAVLVALDHGYQAALMVPTEVLAEQHYRVISGQIESFGYTTVLLTGSASRADRQELTELVDNHEPILVIGTQALIQNALTFSKLGLVIIDEQHRFGALQRATLVGKGESPHVLVMTATPIPRSLAMTVYGHLDLSIIPELPPGRVPVETIWFRDTERDAAYDRLRSMITKGHQAYVVAPLVEESEHLDVSSATELFFELSNSVLSDMTIELLHGRMSGVEKDRSLTSFSNGICRVLVCTTVIEVGVDVPGAGVMLIDGAERFGLSQLHQLRGRIGRGGQKALCIVVSGSEISDEAERRLAAFVSTTDGFELADKDMDIRGPGELLGSRQHGRLPDILFTKPRLVTAARQCAESIIDMYGIDPLPDTYIRRDIAGDLLGSG